MNACKKTLISFALAALSSTAFAAGTPTYAEVRAAIDNTLAKVEEAKASVDTGAANESVIKQISTARQLQKDIANQDLDLKRNQAASVLKTAREEVERNDLAAAKQSLADAIKRFKEIKQLYAASHS
jgi:hypothetical protein